MDALWLQGTRERIRKAAVVGTGVWHAVRGMASNPAIVGAIFRSLGVALIVAVIGLVAATGILQRGYDDFIKDQYLQFLHSVAPAKSEASSAAHVSRLQRLADVIAGVDGVSRARIWLDDGTQVFSSEYGPAEETRIYRVDGNEAVEAVNLEISFENGYLRGLYSRFVVPISALLAMVMAAALVVGIVTYHVHAAARMRRLVGADDGLEIRADGDPIAQLARMLRELRLQIDSKVNNETADMILDEAEGILLMALDGVEAAVAIFSADGHCIEVNRSFRREFPEVAVKVDGAGQLDGAAFEAALSEAGFHPTAPEAVDGTTMFEGPSGRSYRRSRAALEGRGAVVSFINLTELERARRQARRARETVEEIVGAVEIGYQIWSAEQRLVYWRSVNGALVHESNVAISAVSFADYMAQCEAEGQADDPDRSTKRDGRTFSGLRDLAAGIGTWERYGTDGTYLRTTVTRLSDGSYAVVSQDLTDLDNARAAAARNMRLASLGSMVAGLGHEANTPLGVCVTGVSILISTISDLNKAYASQTLSEDDFRKGLKKLSDTTSLVERQLNKAIDLHRNLAQVAVDHAQEERRTIDVAGYVQDVVRSLAPQWQGTPHRFVAQSAGPVIAETYPGAIAQIVSSLSSNALAHAFNRRNVVGTAVIDVGEDDDSVILRYADDGIGLSASAERNFFEPFYTMRRGSGGTGLGMTIVHNLVTHNLGGSIELTKQEKGLGLVIRLPRIGPRQKAA